MTKSNVNPNHYKVAGRERQGEDIAQARNKQKHAESLVAARTGPHARFPKTPGGVRAVLTSKKTATKTATKSAKATKKTATKKVGTPNRHG
jgi:hypothetical protein